MSLAAERKLLQVRAQIRKDLKKHGTNVEQNEADPYGDGDQSLVLTGGFQRQQFYRDLYSNGGDINYLADVGLAPLSEFAKHCITGNVDGVRASLEQADTDPEKPTEALLQLLEKRETTQRQSPLMMTISIGKNIGLPAEYLVPRQLEAVKLLLQYGARPDVRDVCGKTVCHYGMGAMATDMTLEACGYCIDAYQSSHLFNKEVELHSLEEEDMNGLRGLCRGFVADTGLRSVYLFDRKETVAIKPDNLQLVGDHEHVDHERTKLCDIQDRLGGVALIEVLMQNKVAIAKVLLKKYDARIDLRNVEGLSPQSMAEKAGALSLVGSMIMKNAMKHGRAEKKEREGACAQCGKLASATQKCGQCQSVYYCSRLCQVAHWKQGGHKQECSKLVAAQDEVVVLKKPPPGGKLRVIMSATNLAGGTTPKGKTARETFRKPSSVKFGDQFYIKIQGSSQQGELMIYDKSREFQAYVAPGAPGFAELYAKVAADPAAGGRKTYLKCSFNDSGKCTIFLATRSVKTW